MPYINMVLHTYMDYKPVLLSKWQCAAFIRLFAIHMIVNRHTTYTWSIKQCTTYPNYFPYLFQLQKECQCNLLIYCHEMSKYIYLKTNKNTMFN